MEKELYIVSTKSYNNVVDKYNKLQKELAKEREKTKLLEIDCLASLNWRINKEQELAKEREKLSKAANIVLKKDMIIGDLKQAVKTLSN